MFSAATRKLPNLNQTLPYIMIAAGLVGGWASFILTYDKLHLLQNPDYNPSCNINPILSCGSVMKTAQANLFGIPNSIFGLVAFSMLLMLGVTIAAGASLRRWMWIAIQLAATAGIVFMHYLFFQGIFRIHAICPWCFVVWMITIPTFWYITLHNLRHSYLRLPKFHETLNDFFHRHHGDSLVLWYLIIFGIIVVQFWYYWSTLLD